MHNKMHIRLIFTLVGVANIIDVQVIGTGRVNGISGNVDMDYCYSDYPVIVKNGRYNGYKKATAKKTTSTATTAYANG